MNIRDHVQYFFNWKKHPASVFYFAIPLAVIGFGSVFLAALLRYIYFGDIGYLIIWGVSMVLLGVALVPAWRMHQANKKFDELNSRPR